MQTRTKILVFLAVWRRPEITELCFVGLERLKKHPDFDIQVLAVISEESMIALCRKYSVEWVMTENQPLGKKKNIGLRRAKHYDFDYVLEIGSDDLVLNELLDSYKPFIEKQEKFFGIADAAYICSETGSCRRLTTRNSTYGAARMIHRSVLEKFGFAIWHDKAIKGLDNNSVFNLMRYGISYKKVAPMEFPGVIDVKSQENIWKFNYLIGVPYDIELIFEHLSPKEVGMIKEFYAVNQD